MQSSKNMLLVAAIVAASGCATKTYVDESVAKVEARQDEQEERMDELSTASLEALERATEAGVLAEGKFLYSVVFTDDGFKFDSNSSTMSGGAESRLADLAEQLRGDNRNVYMEIQGHTDATGPGEYNQYLGMQRAEAVRRALHSQGVALDRMATISYGEDEPVASNDTADGRAANRRVEVVVLE